MKKRHYITLAIVAVGLVSCVVIYRHPRQLPVEQCSEEYRRYKDAEGVVVSFIKDFPVNDTLSVDVTTLQAQNDSAWHDLMIDFGASEDFFEMYNSRKDILEGEDNYNSIFLFTIDKNDPGKRMAMDDPNSQLVIGSFSEKTLCIYLTDNTDLKNIIGKTKIKKLKQ